MKKLFKALLLILFYIINFTWGILQNLLGLVFLIKYRKCRKERYYNTLLTYHEEGWGGISLGIFLFIGAKHNEAWQTKARPHELGHTIQSLILGPLFLIIIGLPSVIWCNFCVKVWRNPENNNAKYDDFYPERNANWIGEKITGIPLARGNDR
ncbi:MAG: hypothetical protein FWD49_03130 [Firmicutes bacterium]|nr:hypothetical protein [Bacillota bacterium]